MVLTHEIITLPLPPAPICGRHTSQTAADPLFVDHPPLPPALFVEGILGPIFKFSSFRVFKYSHLQTLECSHFQVFEFSIRVFEIPSFCILEKRFQASEFAGFSIIQIFEF